MVMRMPIRPSFPVPPKPVAAPRRRMALPFFTSSELTVDTPSGASLLTNL
jgi:hypothetical protein